MGEFETTIEGEWGYATVELSHHHPRRVLVQAAGGLRLTEKQARALAHALLAATELAMDKVEEDDSN